MRGFVAFVEGYVPDTATAELLTTAAASYHVGVDGETIRKWVQRGHLEVADRDSRGRPLYRWLDVARAEKARRDTGRSRRQFG